jgi:hypothetical protein
MALAVALLCLEGYIVFVDRDGVFAIESRNVDEIAEFGNGAVVSHAFLMRGDGLHSVRIQLNTDVRATVRIQWVLWNGTPEQPAQFARAFDGVAAFNVSPGRKWHALHFPRNGSSNDRWFTIELRLLDVAAASGSRRPQVSLVASRDNLRLGGALWVNEARKPGSLFLRAAFTGRTLHRRFLIEAVPQLPDFFQIAFVQWTVFGLLHCAFLVFAYSVIMDAEGST